MQLGSGYPKYSLFHLVALVRQVHEIIYFYLGHNGNNWDFRFAY